MICQRCRGTGRIERIGDGSLYGQLAGQTDPCPICRGIGHATAAVRIDELENALNSLLGLITLIADRDDLPLPIREALITSHRTREANRVTANSWLGDANPGMSADYRAGWIAAIEAASRYLDDIASHSTVNKEAVKIYGAGMRKDCLPPRLNGVEG